MALVDSRPNNLNSKRACALAPGPACGADHLADPPTQNCPLKPKCHANHWYRCSEVLHSAGTTELSDKS